MSAYDRDLKRAYGDYYPGSPARWQRQQAEREWMASALRARAERERLVKALWARVHPDQARHAEIVAECRDALRGLREVVANGGEVSR